MMDSSLLPSSSQPVRISGRRDYLDLKDAPLPTGHVITPDESCESGEPKPTKGIPIHGMRRTRSELQLQEDQLMAEYRDYCMYVRILSGMSQSSKRLEDSCSPLGGSWRSVTEESISSIIRTRHEPLEQNATLGLDSKFQHIRYDDIYDEGGADYPPSHVPVQGHYKPGLLAIGCVEQHLNAQAQGTGHQDPEDIFSLDM